MVDVYARSLYLTRLRVLLSFSNNSFKLVKKQGAESTPFMSLRVPSSYLLVPFVPATLFVWGYFGSDSYGGILDLIRMGIFWI